MRKYHWQAGSGRALRLVLNKSDIEAGSHSGACDDSVAYLRTLPRIAKQLDAMDAQTLSAELKDYGAWDDSERADHDANLSRILWLACGDIRENPIDYLA